MGTLDSIALDLIRPLHPVRQEWLFDELVADMTENGWQGRPLIVIERESDYLAWTGSHRVAAAADAGLTTILCYVIQEGELTRHGFEAEWGHVFDDE
ncbi:MAG TPA: ParB/RepB/Spo0J family partition protein, partial [Terriglobia bacterium]|nr:ParB/RepB/Spo0J family partition protein [Terriglobia bacterium]